MSTTEVASSEAVIEIRAVVDAANHHQNDPDQFLPLHTDDVRIVNVAGIRVLGRDVLGRAMRQALDTRLDRVITRSEIIDIAFPQPDVAIVSCLKHIDDQNLDSDDADLPSTASLTYVMVRQDGGWRIALAQTTPKTG